MLRSDLLLCLEGVRLCLDGVRSCTGQTGVDKSETASSGTWYTEVGAHGVESVGVSVDDRLLSSASRPVPKFATAMHSWRNSSDKFSFGTSGVDPLAALPL